MDRGRGQCPIHSWGAVFVQLYSPSCITMNYSGRTFNGTNESTRPEGCRTKRKHVLLFLEYLMQTDSRFDDCNGKYSYLILEFVIKLFGSKVYVYSIYIHPFTVDDRNGRKVDNLSRVCDRICRMESSVTLYVVFTLRPIPSILQFPVMTQLRLLKQKDNRHSDTSDS